MLQPLDREALIAALQAIDIAREAIASHADDVDLLATLARLQDARDKILSMMGRDVAACYHAEVQPKGHP
jgi:hypothetical protein